MSEASREVANLTERKNPHTPIYGVKEFVCMSVCSSVTMCAFSKNGEMHLLRPDLEGVYWLKSNFNTKIATQTFTIRGGYEICQINFTST